LFERVGAVASISAIAASTGSTSASGWLA